MQKQEIDALIHSGDHTGLIDAIDQGVKVSQIMRRIRAALYSTRGEEKWHAVSALGMLVKNGLLPDERLEDLVHRLVWSLNDESGAVPYGSPEALGELASVDAEIQDDILPLLISYTVDHEVVQTGVILAGAVWAVGHNAPLDVSETERFLPGLVEALTAEEAELRGSAAWAAGRVGLVFRAEEQLRQLLDDGAEVTLLSDGVVRRCSVGELAREAVEQGLH